MKRYASHYLFLPGVGYLKQYAVEMEEGCVIRIFPLSEEIENTEWLPGVIVLLPESEQITEDFKFDKSVEHSTFPSSWEEGCPKGGVVGKAATAIIPSTKQLHQLHLIPYLFYPFDFTTMQPVAGTQHRQLR